MRRRRLFALVGAVVAVWPLAANTQPPPMSVVGLLTVGQPGEPGLAAWRRALHDSGFDEGRNLTVEFRRADRGSQLPELAAEFVRRRVNVIMAVSGLAARAAKTATTSIPIVFAFAIDPVGLGLVETLQRPGGNVTGIAATFDGLTEKRLQLLHEIIPAAARIGYLVNPENPNPAHRIERIAVAAKTLGVEIVVMKATTPDEIERAVSIGVENGIAGLILMEGPSP